MQEVKSARAEKNRGMRPLSFCVMLEVNQKVSLGANHFCVKLSAMEFFEVIDRRRSVRKYTSKPVPEEVMRRAVDAALRAPNSSNMQTWRFCWVKSLDKKKALAEACLNQTAARTAQELVVAYVSPRQWAKTQKEILKALDPSLPLQVRDYYKKLMPFLYGFRFLAPVKWFLFNVAGLFRPTPRKPWSGRDIDEVCIKSSALACENFMLAIAAQNFDTCPMEGFDECRVKKILGLRYSDRVVMVISVGERAADGVWGSQFRLPRDMVFREL